jgi:AcrR family transcriptional regulator
MRSDQRARIIEAAYVTLAERGYDATSIKDIAQAAGVAPGLIHYYFASKAELLAAVVQEASDRVARGRLALGEAKSGAALADAALARVTERVTHEPDWYRLRYDLFALGLRNPALAQSVAGLLATGRASIAANLRPLATSDVRPVADRETVAAIMQASFDGLALQKVIDPEFDFEGACRLLFRLARQVDYTD